MGPRSAPLPSSNDAAALLMAAMLPLITSHLAPAAASAPAVPPSGPTTPSCNCNNKAVTPFSPAPNTDMELHVCLGDFLRSKGIDLMGSESALMELELTPNIVADVPVARLCEVMGAVEGRVRKFQVLCREWVAHLEEKQRCTA